MPLTQDEEEAERQRNWQVLDEYCQVLKQVAREDPNFRPSPFDEATLKLHRELSALGLIGHLKVVK